MLNARDYLRAAKQRLTTAEFLLDHDYSLDAFYLAGYAVECGLKALILHATREENRYVTYRRISSGARMHYAETLKEELRIVGHPIPLELLKRFRRFGWSLDLRYESGRKRTGEVRGFLKTASRTLEWVEGELQ